MAVEVYHIDKRGYSLTGDARHILLPTNSRDKVISWCGENQVDAIMRVQNFDGYDLWEIKDDQQRSWFLLKWINLHEH